MQTSATLTVGMLLYPNFTLLDLAGPQLALGLSCRTLLLWKDSSPVPTDTGVSLNPTTKFADCPKNLDVLFVPGGTGSNEAMNDAQILQFLAGVGRTARYVTSVCSGSVLLGMAGLLDGYKATTHWALFDALAETGAIPVKQRVVTDRNRITGGGVTAGIDFGLTLLAMLRDEHTAKVTQLIMEYDPAPPYDCGTPDKADPAVIATALDVIATLPAEALQIARARRTRSAA